MNNNEKIPNPRKKNLITFQMVKDAIQNINQFYSKSDYIKNDFANNNNPTNYLNEDNKAVFIDGIENFLDQLLITENICWSYYKTNTKNFNNIQKNIKYILKLIYSNRTKKIKLFKLITDAKKINFAITSILYLLRQYINENQHEQIKNILIYLLFLSSEKILPNNTFKFTIEIFINILTNMIISKKNIHFSLNEEPLSFINDIIESICKYPKEIVINNPDKYILIEIINLFDNYLLKPNYENADFNKSTIWLKLIGNHIMNALTNNKDIGDQNNNNNLEIGYSKFFSFLIKIYKYNMPDEYFSNIFIERGTIDLAYYSNSLKFLRNLFKEEEKLKSSNDFRITKGFIIPEESAISVNNLKFKINEFCIIFSFRIDSIANKSFDNNISLFNLFYKSEKDKEKIKIMLSLSVDNRSHNLYLFNSNDKKWDTGIKITIGKDYFVCLTQKISLLKSNLHIYINEQPKAGEENHIQKGKAKTSENFYFSSIKANFPDFQKEMTLELGKNNFCGIMGEFIMINKKIKKENVQHILNIKKNYSEILSDIYHKNSLIEYIYSKSNDESIKFFKSLDYEIKLEILTYRLNQNRYKIIQKFNSYDINDIKNNEDDIKLYELKYSSLKLYQEKGIEFLIFQLHNITSTLDDNQLINIYIYKTISFIYDLILNLNEYLVDTTIRQIPKMDQKIIIFFFTLLTILFKKKGKLNLDDNNQNLLLELLDYIRFNNLFFVRNILVSILLEENFFDKKKNFEMIRKIINSLVSDLTNNSNNDISLICHEFLYKILLHDYIYESKSIEHKSFMRLISSFLNVEHYKKNENLWKIQPSVCEAFINYILGLKSENKIYHYLKIIFINSTKMKEKLIENAKFIEYINIKMEKINTNHCKYCLFLQILCYLINVEIYINSSNENDYCFHFNPSGFMKSPNFYFIKCIFIQCFNISNESKMKFIKSKLKGIDFLKKMKDYTNVITLINGIKFIPKFKAVVDYIKFLYNEQQNNTNDSRLITVIKDTINLFLSLFEEIYFQKKKVNDDNDLNNNINDDQIYQNFCQEFLCCEGMKIFYSLYLSINHNKALNDIKKYISISVKSVFNGFYFFLFSTSLFFDDDINSSFSYADTNDNNNQQIKSKLLDMLSNKLINQKIYKDKNDVFLVQNNTLLLVYIYQNIINNKISLTEDIEKNTILFINFIIDNDFINSKYVFDLNTSLVTDQKEPHNFKFLPEIILDILFILYDYKQYDLKYHYLIKRFCISRERNKRSNFFLIDKQHFTDNKSRTLFYKFFNENYFEKICNAVQVSDIMYTIYFLFVLIDKKHKYQIEDKEPIKLINDILNVLFADVIQLYNDHFPKITMVKKNVLNKYPYKMYKYFLIFIENKYKDKTFTLDKLFKYYIKLINTKDILTQRKSHLLNEEFLNNFILSNSINNEINNKILSSKTIGEELRLTVLTNRGVKINRNREIFKKEERKKSLPQVNMRLLRIKMIEMLEEESNQLYYTKSSYIDPELKTYSSKNLRNNSSIGKENDDNINNNNIHDNENNENNQKHIPYSIFKSNKKKTNKKVKFAVKESENKENGGNELSASKQPETNNTDENQDPDFFLVRSSSKTLTKKDMKSYKTETPNETDFIDNLNDSSNNDIEKANDSSSSMSSEEINYEEYDISKILNRLNIPSIHYKSYFHLSDKSTTKMLVNPKQYFLWKIFAITFKNYIFKNKKFGILKKSFDTFFKDVNLSKTDNYYLQYPTKLKNFICDDYYRPFLKPDFNFFRHKLLINTHSYVDKTVLYKQYFEDDKFYSIRFERLIPVNYDIKNKSKKIGCEIINNKGSVYGNIYFNHAFMMFISNTSNDPRNDNKKMKDEQLMMFYLYSYYEEERIKDKNKYIIIYFEEIKEIIIRRFCFNYIGYEIFTKDNKSHLFNFFNKKTLKDFVTTLKRYSNLLKKKNSIGTSNTISDLNANIPIIHIIVNDEINFNIINDPLNYFEKNEYKQKYLKGEITNFKYLLIVNKYSSRTFKDNSQYLIFPLLYMDTKKKIKRDLSKAICLNKKNCDISYFIENFKTTGCHFNNHYSSNGYILYYLVRLFPFTFNHVKLQSGHFDSPERIFSTFDNFLFVLSNSDENRELCPELYCNYEPFINLNLFNLGFIDSDNIQINDFSFDSKQGIIQFIINSRKMLEATNISQWIDNIFGVNQFMENCDSMNIFPLSSYEQLHNFEEDKKNMKKKGKSRKEIYNDIQLSINLLTIGITPVQIFRAAHPNRGSNSFYKKSFSSSLNNNNSFSNFGMSTLSNIDNKENKKKKINSIDNIYQFIENTSNNEYLLFSISNENNNYGAKVVAILSEIVYVYKLNTDESKNQGPLKIENKKKQIQIEPYSNICCELFTGFFCFCRYIDNTLEIKSEKFCSIYRWKCLITAVEFCSHEFINNGTVQKNVNLIIFGDENGYLNLLKIEIENISKKQIFQTSIELMNQVKTHNTYIKGINFHKRLNIIIAIDNTQITIINAYSFDILNLIDLGTKYDIYNAKLSGYDLLFVSCYNNLKEQYYIKSYTLNGVKGSKLKTKSAIVNHFINEDTIIVVYLNNKIEIYPQYNLKDQYLNYIEPCSINSRNKINSDIMFCDFNPKNMKLFMIYCDKHVIALDMISDDN